MIRRTIRRLKFMSDMVRMPTTSISDANQALWGFRLTDTVCTRAQERHKKTGYILYYLLPPKLAEVFHTSIYDPYEVDYSMDELRQWIWDHLVFDNTGDIIAMHNNGELLLVREDSHVEADMFSRVRRRREHAVQRRTL